jgi:hypothetical protein
VGRDLTLIQGKASPLSPFLLVTREKTIEIVLILFTTFLPPPSFGYSPDAHHHLLLLSLGVQSSISDGGPLLEEIGKEDSVGDGDWVQLVVR